MDRPGEEKELDKLRKTIEEFRAKAERNGANVFTESRSANSTPQSDMGYPSSDTGPWSAPSAFSAPALASGRHFDTLSPNSTIGKRVSSGSLSSMSSHASHSSVSSSSSGSSADSDQRQNKKKRWLPLKSAFSRGSRSSHSSGHNDFTDPDDSGCLISPTSTSRSFRNTSVSSLDGGSIDQASYNDILQIVQEKDRKLTDVRLEALTSQHQLHQLQDQIVQMQHEMQLLRLENERLQACSTNYVTPDLSMNSNLRLKLSPSASLAPSIGIECSKSPEGMASSQFSPTATNLDCCKLHRLVSPGSEEEGSQMRFVVSSPTTIQSPTQHRHPTEIVIGSIPVSRKTNWDGLDRMTSDIFLEYCRCVDGDNRLGLSASSIAFYKVGEQTRVPGTRPPELLPCAFIVGNVDKVEISIKDASCGNVDLMAFRTLIPKDILLRYITAILQQRRVILHGPSGTGKSSISYSIANHLVERERRANSREDALYVYDVKQSGEEELKTYLKSVSEMCSEAETKIPHVIIVENCYLMTSFYEILSPLVNWPKGRKCPYVIGTMLQGKPSNDDSDYVWISCTNNSLHVKDYLARRLRRCVIENEIAGEQTCEDEFQNMLRVITWLPLCWHHVNRCLEGQCAGDVTIGPRVFASCPTEFYSSCSWFVQVWNHVIAPYVIAAVRRIRQSHSSEKQGGASKQKWVDPTDWVIESFPWSASDMGCDNTLRLKHITNDDLDCPPVPPRTDLMQYKNQKAKGNARHHPDHILTINNPNYTGSCGSRKAPVSRQNSKKYNTEECKGLPVPPMELMGLRDNTEGTTVWHRHNSPMTSPSKTVIHAGVSRNIH